LSAYQLEIRAVGMKYQTPQNETEAIAEISLTVSPGEFVSLVGPSGCGKSTLLDIICGLAEPTRGEARIKGKVGYMLQRDHLLEWRTILDNCLLGPEIQKYNLKEARRNVLYLLERYGLGSFAHYYPRQLSGGMRQRAALIRTLAINPDILLLDEPFAALDYQTRLAIADEVANILRQERKTALMVTHDIAEAISMSDRVVVLSARPARVKSIYPIELPAGLSPLARRQENDFRSYFDAIWKELDVHVDPA
jgi:NitT/TauT family transport system ATP-binding protein